MSTRSHIADLRVQRDAARSLVNRWADTLKASPDPINTLSWGVDVFDNAAFVHVTSRLIAIAEACEDHGDAELHAVLTAEILQNVLANNGASTSATANFADIRLLNAWRNAHRAMQYTKS